MQIYFITATGTEVGKTFYVEKEVRRLVGEGKQVAVIKPVISGVGNTSELADDERILHALGKEVTKETRFEMAPFRYDEAASPDIAALRENKTQIDYVQLLGFCSEFIKKNQDKDVILIEGVGGVMVPINKEKNILDLIKDLNIPVKLITANYLGTISHSLTSYQALKNFGIKDADIEIIFNDIIGNTQILNENINAVKNFVSCEVNKI